MESFIPKCVNKARRTAFITPIQHYSGSLSLGSKTRKRNNSHTDWQRRNKRVPIHRHNCLCRKIHEKLLE